MHYLDYVIFFLWAIREDSHSFLKIGCIGIPGWRSGLALAQGAILETRNRIPRRAPGAWSLILPLSLPLSLSLSVTIINKLKIKKKILPLETLFTKKTINVILKQIKTENNNTYR